MSITTDIKTRADEVAKQGRKAGKTVVDAAQTQLATAQTQLVELTDAVTSNVTGAVNDLREQAEKTVEPYVTRVNKTVEPYVTRVNKTVEPYVTRVNKTVEPYVAQAKGYADTARTRAEGLLDTVTADKRVAKVVDTAQQLSETVQARVLAPVRTRTARPAATVRTTAAKATPAKATPASVGREAGDHQAGDHEVGHQAHRPQEHRAHQHRKERPVTPRFATKPRPVCLRGRGFVVWPGCTSSVIWVHGCGQPALPVDRSCAVLGGHRPAAMGPGRLRDPQERGLRGHQPADQAGLARHSGRVPGAGLFHDADPGPDAVHPGRRVPGRRASRRPAGVRRFELVTVSS